MSLFTGAGVAIVTPMNADGSVNYEKLAEILEFQIANETDAIIICGTTGESATLSEEEHSEVIRFCIKTVNHRIPVVAGTGSNCTETAVKLSKEAEEAGADGLLVTTRQHSQDLSHTLPRLRVRLKSLSFFTMFQAEQDVIFYLLQQLNYLKKWITS